MDLSTLQIFIDVVRRGSFAAVAREMDVAASSISRSVNSLEKELGIRLFQRSTRRMKLTEAGMVYYSRVEPLVDEILRAQTMAVDIGEHPKGRLRITAPVTFGQISLIPLLPEFSEAYPDLSLEIIMTDSVVDLLTECIDVAIRLGPLEDSTFIASRLCKMDFAICASPDYLARHAPLQTPPDIRQHNCLLFPIAGYRSRWLFRNPKGRITEVPVNGRCSISNANSLMQCALRNMGLALLPRWVVRNEIESGALIDIFPDYDVTATEFDTAAWLLYPSREYLPLKVRAFVDFLKQRFSESPP
ncbi:MAG TPA: LysR family transcriptional regulator [Gammaproteobacteria bacterium]|nr:LysR family transcriptional regulator [Gammaproteobacteria bacterium]